MTIYRGYIIKEERGQYVVRREGLVQLHAPGEEDALNWIDSQLLLRAQRLQRARDADSAEGR